MVFKPMEESVYLAYLKMVGWRLSKAGIDYSLFDEKGAVNSNINSKKTYENICKVHRLRTIS